MRVTIQFVPFLKLTSLLFLFFFFIGFGVGVSKSPPKHAIVFVDSTEKAYFAPPCVKALDKRTTLIESTIEKIYNLKLNPNPECLDTGAFLQDARSLSGQLLVKIGILKPLKSRWNTDGSWNW
jgi:hypothetical protein